ncbi:MAG TPA: protein kinase [Gemmatales bacterium]|nr:protein kinase [Gemmatales bacterium]
MQVSCEVCERRLEYSGDRPSFCAYCGKPLGTTHLARTDSYQQGEPSDTTSATQLPPPNRIISFAGMGVHRTPDQIGGYKIVRQIGSGGMGTVFEAEDAVNGRSVAIKLIKPQIAASSDNLERFRQEGRLASLITHPRCVFVYHADEDKGRPYIVMELMPGATLKDIVSQQGPLQIGQAITKILDVIDGLMAAHQLGVIHRDVKPSNCFVLTDGHVKVGDFGLSKILPLLSTSTARTPELHHQTTPDNNSVEGITRTGVFVGTPLFASPEQIKGEMVDYRTDVYSVTATLYFLLTGQAPFEGGDNTATIARIVSEDPASVQAIRPDVPTELDRVIQRGLQRDRDIRYATLSELRSALMQFKPGYLHNAPRRARIRAAIVDMALLAPEVILIHQVIPYLMPPTEWGVELIDFVSDLCMWLFVLTYFLVTEVVAGTSFGKWLLHLRVGGLRPGKPPKRRQLLLRAMGFFVVVALPGLLALALTGNDWVKWLFHFIGMLLLFDSMRAQGGFRGLHEIMSNTCVVQVPPTPKQLEFPYIPPLAPAKLPPGLPSRIGNYAIEGIHRVLDDRIFLVGKDLILNRPVWLVMRPLEEGKIAPARREISRSTRLRWLGGGDVNLATRSNKHTHHWDAFIAPTTGCSLARLVQVEGKLSWTTSRLLLQQLADELAIALTDDTFPDGLSLEQVWLQPEGQLLIVGARFHESAPLPLVDSASDAERSVLFLKQAAQLMLEGKISNPQKPRPIAAPMPWYDRPILDRLVGIGNTLYTNPGEIAKDLHASANRPTEVTSMMRLGQMLFTGLLLSPIILAILLLSRYYLEIKPTLQLTHQVRRAERMVEWFGDKKNIPLFKQYLLDNPEEARYVSKATLVELLASPPISLIRPVSRDRFMMAACKGKIKQQLTHDVEQLQQLRNQLSLPAFLPQLAALEMLASPSKTTERNRELFGVQGLPEDIKLTLRHAVDPQHQQEEVLPLVQKLTPFQLACIPIGTWLIVWIVWSMVTRGGISLKFMGIDLQQSQGKRAGPLRCGWRSLLVWLPFFTLILFSVWVQAATTSRGHQTGLWVYWIPWWLGLIYLAACAMCTLIWPKRGLHDRLSGVYLMPR